MSLKDITLGRFVYGKSLLHRLDPRTKLLLLFVVMIGLFAGNGWAALGLATCCALIGCLLSGLPLLYLLRSLVPFKWLIAMTFLLNVLFVGGHILVEAPLPYGGITSEGIELGLLYSLRIALLILLASLLTLTTQPVTLVAGVEKLLKPFAGIGGFNPHETAIAMVITIRFIPVLLGEAVKIQKSHRALGLRTDTGIGVKLRSISLMLTPLFVSAIKRAEDLAVAMDSRLYRGAAQRTRYHDTRMMNLDWSVLAVGITVALVMAFV